jgi:glycosyltransferase involved in cell wall biosynthesis
VTAGDERALAQALLDYVGDADLRQAHGAAGRARCELDFSIEHCATEYARLFAELGGLVLPLPVSEEPALEEVNA